MGALVSLPARKSAAELIEESQRADERARRLAADAVGALFPHAAVLGADLEALAAMLSVKPGVRDRCRVLATHLQREMADIAVLMAGAP